MGVPLEIHYLEVQTLDEGRQTLIKSQFQWVDQLDLYSTVHAVGKMLQWDDVHTIYSQLSLNGHLSKVDTSKAVTSLEQTPLKWTPL